MLKFVFWAFAVSLAPLSIKALLVLGERVGMLLGTIPAPAPRPLPPWRPEPTSEGFAPGFGGDQTPAPDFSLTGPTPR